MKKHVLLIVIMGLFLSANLFAHTQTIESEGVTIKITEIKQIGKHLMVKMLVTSTEDDKNVRILHSNARVIDMDDDITKSLYKSQIGESICRGSNGNSRSELIAGVPVKAYIMFKGNIAEEKKLKLIEFPVYFPQKNKKIKVSFKNLTVPYYASGNGFTNSNKHFEIADKIFMKITSVEKNDNKLVVHYTLTSEKADKEIEPKPKETRMFDSRGNTYVCNKASLGDKSHYRYVKNTLRKDVSLDGTFVFEDSKIKDIQKIAMLQLALNENSFKVKNIAVAQ